MKTVKNSKQMLFEMMGKIDPTFKPKLNESQHRSWHHEYEVELEFDDIVNYIDNINPALELKVVDGMISFTVEGELVEDWSHKPGTESDSVSFLYLDNYRLVDGTYQPEFKEVIEAWAKENNDTLEKWMKNDLIRKQSSEARY